VRVGGGKVDFFLGTKTKDILLGPKWECPIAAIGPSRQRGVGLEVQWTNRQVKDLRNNGISKLACIVARKQDILR
jgi:hypothetical protein